MKRLTSKRVFLSIILAVFTVGSLASLVSISQPATVSALTPAEIRECYNAFNTATNGKEVNYNYLTSAEQTLYNKCQEAGTCVDAGIGTNDTNSRKNSCTNPNTIPDNVVAASNDAKLAPVVTVFCGAAPAGEAAQTVFLSCESKVTASYTSCNTSGGGITSAVEATDADLAACLKTKMGGSATVKSITTAVAKGRVDGAKSIDAEIQRQTEGECVGAGGTFKDGTCTPAAGKETCRGGGLGWILCPLTDALVGAITGIAGLVQQLLTVKPLILGDGASGDAIYTIWKMVVGLANLALVAAFLVVIFSQATSVGLSAYGIKKMLPRIIAAAILINLSYFICALSVDLANILGGAVQGIVALASSTLPNSNLRSTNYGDNFLTLIASLTTVSILAYTGAIFYILPVIASAAVSILTALFVLATRQVLITLLIIVSPLAFAAFVLPNTESLFKKWGKLFMILLIMYPLIMLLFYGSMLMSKLISVTAPGDSAPITTQIITDLMSVIVLIVPLFALPTLMKLAGGILERFGGIVNDRSKGLIDRSRKKADEMKGSTAYQQGKSWRKKAKEDYKAGNLAKRLQGKGGWTPYDRYSQFAARGLSGNLGRIPVIKNTPIVGGGWRAQNEVVDRAARGRVASATSEEVKAEITRLSASDDGRSISSIREYVSKNASSLSDTQMRAAGELLLSKPGAKGTFRKLIENPDVMKHNGAEGLIDAGLGSEGFRAAHPDISNAFEKGSLVGITGDVATGKISSYTGANFVAGAGGNNSRGVQIVEDSFNWEKVARRSDSVLKLSENNADYVKNLLTQDTAIAARDSDTFAGADPNIRSLINHVANGNPGSTWTP